MYLNLYHLKLCCQFSLPTFLMVPYSLTFSTLPFVLLRSTFLTLFKIIIIFSISFYILEDIINSSSAKRQAEYSLGNFANIALLFRLTSLLKSMATY